MGGITPSWLSSMTVYICEPTATHQYLVKDKVVGPEAIHAALAMFGYNQSLQQPPRISPVSANPPRPTPLHSSSNSAKGEPSRKTQRFDIVLHADDQKPAELENRTVQGRYCLGWSKFCQELDNSGYHYLDPHLGKMCMGGAWFLRCAYIAQYDKSELYRTNNSVGQSNSIPYHKYNPAEYDKWKTENVTTPRSGSGTLTPRSRSGTRGASTPRSETHTPRSKVSAPAVIVPRAATSVTTVVVSPRNSGNTQSLPQASATTRPVIPKLHFPADASTPLLAVIPT